jgi:hydroxymethylbilane synthase
MWQAKKVCDLLESNGIMTEIIGIKSKGDKSLGGNLASSVGQFIHAVDSQLIEGNIDIAVHSSKDVPVDFDEQISNLAYLERGCTNDLLIFPKSKQHASLKDLLNSEKETTVGDALAIIPKSGMVGTVSGRRQSFLLGNRPDIIPIAVRGQVETRLKRLKEGRVDAIILAEVGLQRLHQIGALDDWILEFSAIRISDRDWPTAPGQGAISVHCRTDDCVRLSEIREILNHEETETDVNIEREILQSIGGGCLYPAGIKVRGDNAYVQISPMNWKEIFSRGLPFPSTIYHGRLSEFESTLPDTEILDNLPMNKGPKLISTLNSDRLATILQNDGINVVNKPVIELVSKPENWPKSFIDNHSPRSDWPYLILTSPFAAKCAIEVSKSNPDLNRIQWLAIGEGTARACFVRGVTVSICAKARDSIELIDYIDKNIDRKIRLMIPRSNVSNRKLSESLEELGFSTDSWIGYENRSKSVPSIEIGYDDVLLLSSPSSARAWVENSLPIPKSILCMGKSSLEEIDSLGYFSESTVEILKGPTAEFVSKWWKTKRGD